MTKVNTDAKFQMIKKFVESYDKNCPVEQLIIICLGQLYKNFAIKMIGHIEKESASKEQTLKSMIEASQDLTLYLNETWQSMKDRENE